MLKTILLVGLGGGAGSIMRYLVSYYMPKLFPVHHVLGTFAANILGCLLVGLLLALFERNHLMDSHLRFLFITGFCGGFTTFSTFSSESLQLFQSGNWLWGVLYILSSILLGLLAVRLGFLLIR